MLEVLDQENRLALADALTGAGERIAAGETVSGPAADCYRAAATAKLTPHDQVRWDRTDTTARLPISGDLAGR
ncbi:hypothetical protein [Streptomyces anthocyanicus]|uniref:hypothetical protein n=1 Tax=Streptomyces anthocyanicus TaxID=68174 RepID=UPI002F90F347|nr:hypothetical protein OH747_40740 [Streptomyces anthocyanicus]